MNDLKDDIAGLVEWFDLASFVLSPIGGESSEGRRRELYTDILKAVRELEKKGVTVLAGVLPLPQYGIADWKLAMLNITRKSKDPGAMKRRFVFVDERAIGEASKPFVVN